MTKEEREEAIVDIRDNIKPVVGGKSLDMAIEALLQESILEKIRAEIEQNAYPIVHGVNNHEKGMTLYGILQIIDKYRGKEDETDN